jgi:hypothetical protein
MYAATRRSICQEAVEDLKELGRLRNEVEALAAGLDQAAFLRRPGEGQWSVGECIAHLNTTARSYISKLHGTVDEARRRGLTGAGPVKRGLVGAMFVWSLEPPPKRKVRAPRTLLPPQDLSKEEVMREFRAVRNELGELMDGSGDLDWSRVKMGLPTIPWLKLRLGAIYAALLAHERRHLWQMRRVIGDKS